MVLQAGRQGLSTLRVVMVVLCFPCCVFQVAALRGVNVVQLACGGEHTLAITGDGDVWAWGKGADGELGMGDSVTLLHKPEKLTVWPQH